MRALQSPGLGQRILTFLTFVCLSFSSLQSAQAQDNPFDTLLDASHAGQVIQAQSISGAPEGAVAYKILYTSVGLHDETIMVSGMVIVPSGAAPLGGRPIIAWAHPTTGVVPRCAPSLARVRFQMIQGLQEMVQRGYVVAATDYPGLGTPETHPYLVGASEARAVIDSVRAAQKLPGVGRANRFAVWGHSQGGQAALFTGMIARIYAPELQLVGVAAAAPATDLAALLKADFDTTGGRNLAAMTLWSWARIYNAPIDTVLDPVAIPTVNRLAGECLESIYDILVRRQTERPLEKHFLRVDNFAQAQPWASLLSENTPRNLPADLPVFIAQGLSDQLVLPHITQHFIKELCRGGSAVSVDLWPGVGHGFIGRKSAAHAIAWIGDRFADRPAPTSCGRK